MHQAMPRGVETKVFAEPFERQRLQSPGNLQLQQMRGRSGRGIGSQQRIGDDFEAFDRDRLNAKIEGSSLPCGIDPCLNQGDELVEDRVLQRDRQRQDAIEPALDRRQIVYQTPVSTLNP